MLVETLAKPLFQKNDVSQISLVQAVGALHSYMDAGHSKVQADKDALDFYFLNHAMGWFRSVRHEQEPYTDNEREFVNLYMEKVSEITARAYNYLLIICTREARHAQAGMKEGGNIFDYLTKEYGLPMSKFMKELNACGSYDSVAHLTKTKLGVSIGRYVKALSDIYYKGAWSGGYGGPAWGAVTDCLDDFVHGKISPEMMTDTVWTLSHNNGPIFNKPFLYEGYSGELISVLDVQRSGQIPQLLWDYKFGETYITSALPAMNDLYIEVTELLGRPDELLGNIDWWKVEMLGAVNSYPQQKQKQEAKYGESLYAKKAKLLEKQATMKALNDKKEELAKYFVVTPGVKLKKLTREELHVG